MTLIGVESLVREIEAEFRYVSATVVFQAVDANGDHVTVNGESIVFSPRVSIVLRDGVPDAVPNLQPTDGSFGWLVKVSILSGRYSREWLKGVPTSTEVVPFGDLPNLDRSTLQPTEDVVAAWDTVRAETFQARTDTEGLRDETQTLRNEAWAAVDTPGRQGSSAYQVAVDAGFTGTESQWLASLHGQDGAPGDDGASAYQLAVAAGFVGTEAQWRASLKGADGENPTPQSYGDALTTAGPARTAVQQIASSKIDEKRGAAGGVAPLDGDAKLPDGYVPVRLEGPSLRREFVRWFRPEQFGAVGDGIHDDTAAILDMYAAVAASTYDTQKASGDDSVNLPVRAGVYFGDGVWTYSTGVTLPQGMDILSSRRSRHRAIAPMSYLMRTDPSVVNQGVTIQLGVLDANGLADNAIILASHIACSFDIHEVYNPLKDGIIVGTAGDVQHSYEAEINVGRIWRPRSALPNVNYPGYAGLSVVRLTDSNVSVVGIRGFDVGTRNNGQNVYIEKGHPWNPSDTFGPSVCHEDGLNAVGTRLWNYVFDSPGQYGLLIKHANPILVMGGHWYLNNKAPDNVAVAVQVEQNAKLDAYGTIYGATDHRWARDIFHVASDSNTNWNVRSDPTTVVNRKWGDRARARGHIYDSGSLTPLQFQLGTGGAFQSYKSGQLRSQLGAEGLWQMPAFATTARPAASAAPNGSYRDTTTNKVMTSDGTNWRDAMGNIG